MTNSPQTAYVLSSTGTLTRVRMIYLLPIPRRATGSSKLGNFSNGEIVSGFQIITGCSGSKDIPEQENRH